MGPLQRIDFMLILGQRESGRIWLDLDGLRPSYPRFQRSHRRQKIGGIALYG